MLDIDTRLQMWVRHCVLSFGANGKYPPAKWWSEFQHGHGAFLLTATTVLSLYLPLREEQKCILGNSDSLKRQLKISMWPPKRLLIWSIFYSGIYPARGLQMRKEKGKIRPLWRGDVRRDRLDIWIPTCSFLDGKTAHLGPVSLWNLPSSNSLVYIGHRVCICLNTLCKKNPIIYQYCKLEKSANRGCNCTIWTKKSAFLSWHLFKNRYFSWQKFCGSMSQTAEFRLYTLCLVSAEQLPLRWMEIRTYSFFQVFKTRHSVWALYFYLCSYIRTYLSSFFRCTYSMTTEWKSMWQGRYKTQSLYTKQHKNTHTKARRLWWRYTFICACLSVLMRHIVAVRSCPLPKQ